MIKGKIDCNAKIVMNQRTKSIFRKSELERFCEEIEKIGETQKKNEAFNTIICLEIGEKILLSTNGEIQLFFKHKNVLKKEPESIITENKELYSLLENLVQS